MIQVYKSSNNNYDFNGNVTILPISCNYKDSEKNLTIEVAYDKKGKWKYIDIDNVIKGKIHGKDQLFRIYKIDKDLDSIIGYARPLMYDLMNYVLLDTRPTQKNGQETLDIILSDTPFTGHSDIYKRNTAYYIRKNIIEALFSDDENSFLNRWGGELYFENFDIYLMSKIGNDNGVRIDEGYNLADIKGTVNFDDVVTRIIPVGYDGITLEGNAPWVDSPIINKYSNILTKVISFEDVKVKTSADDEEGFNTLEEAQQELINRCNKLYEEDIDKPIISYEITVTDDKKLKNVSTGDFVHVYVKKLDLYVATRVADYEYDLLEQKNISVTIGTVEKTYEQKQGDIHTRVNKITNDNGNVKGASIEGVINALQTQFTALRDNAQKQEIRAMLFEDRIPTSATYGAMCIGTMGFEIASSFKPGTTEWDFRTFGTGKGFTADEITAGILTAILIKSLDGSCSINLNTGEVNFSKGIIRGNNSYWNLNTGTFRTSAIYNGDLYETIIDQGFITSNNFLQIKAKDDLHIESTELHYKTTFDSTINFFVTKSYAGIVTENSILLESAYVGIDGNSNITGDLKVEGNKNCIQKTENYGDRLFYSLEDTDSYLTYTEDKLQVTENNLLKVNIDSVFKECVNLDIPFIIEIYKYSFGDYRIKEQTSDYFIIESDKENFEFKYTIKAKRKGFEDKHLDLYERKESELIGTNQSNS